MQVTAIETTQSHMETFSTAVTVSNKTVFLEKPGALQAASVVQAGRWNFLGLWRVDAESQKANLRDSESSLLRIARHFANKELSQETQGLACSWPHMLQSFPRKVIATTGACQPQLCTPRHCQFLRSRMSIDVLPDRGASQIHLTINISVHV